MPPAKNTADIAAADQAPLRGGLGEKFTASSVSAERPTSTSPSYSSKPFLVTSTSWRPGRHLVAAGGVADRLAVDQQLAPAALLAGDADPAVLHLVHVDHVGGGGAGGDLDVLADGGVARPLQPDGVLARLHVAGVGRAADGPDLPLVQEHVGAGHVGGHLDPAQEVLLGQRDVDLVHLVGARADHPFLRLPALGLDDQLHRLGRQRSLPGRAGEHAVLLVVQVDHRARRLGIDDHQALGLDAREHRLGLGRRPRARRPAGPAAP